jgi:hypothetical protein
MVRTDRPTLVWIANLLVPGAGLVLRGHILLGILWAVAWAAAGAGCLLSLVWPDAVVASLTVPLVAVVILAYAWAQVFLGFAIRRAGRWRADGARDARFKDALAAYLHGRLDISEAVCKELLRRDPDDVEATLQLAAIARRRGKPAASARYLRRARYLDDEGRWDFHVGRVLAALRRPAGRARGGRH